MNVLGIAFRWPVHEAQSLIVSCALVVGVSAQGIYFDPGQPVPGVVTGVTAALDVDGDGLRDVLVADAVGIHWIRNLGAGGFAAPAVVAATPSQVVGLATTDFDGDGDVDIVWGSATAFGFVVNLGAGQFSGAVAVGALGVGSALAAVDLDGDGDDDFTYIRNGSRVWRENQGQGFVGAPINVCSAPSVIGDVNGDGSLDFLIVEYGASVSRATATAVLNDGLGNFTVTGAAPLPSTVLVYYSGVDAFILRDMDGDGLDDITIAASNGSTGSLITFAGVGNGQFAVSSEYEYWNSGAFASLAATDVDGDGLPDLVAVKQGVPRVLVSGGVRNWRVELPVAAVGPAFLIEMDVDGDGVGDPVIQSGGQATWWRSRFLVSTATTFGQGCGAPPMTFTPSYRATIGTSISATIANTPTPVCVVAIGWNSLVLPGVGALPVDLGQVGMPGCLLYHSSEFFGLPTTQVGTPFVARFTTPLAGNVAFLGQHIYAQAFSYAPGVNPLQVVSSNAIDWLAGNL